MSHDNQDRPTRPQPEHPRRGPRLPKGILIWVALVILAMLLFKAAGDGIGASTETLSYSELFSPPFFERTPEARRFAADTILEATLDGRTLTGRYSPSLARARGFSTFTCELGQAVQGDQIYRDLETLPKFEVSPGPSFLEQALYALLPWVLLFAVAYFLFFRQLRSSAGPGSILSFGKSRARLTGKEQVKVSFDDVAGIDEATEEVHEVIEFLKDPKKFERLGGRIPRGVLLVGAPGTGKTLLAKAIAGEADVPFYSICGSDFVEMFVGVGASRVRDLFRQAKATAPCIIFLDEVDAVGRRRGSGLGGGHDEREQTLNAILVEMDGFETDDQVIVMAATNRIDVLDPALLRPGRFDREVVIDMPDVKGRLGILQVHAREVTLADDVNLDILARGTPAFSGADLAAIINEAAISAVMAGKDAVEQEDLEEARDKVRWGRAKRSRVMNEQERRVAAFHEAGHALVAKLDPDAEAVHKVTIIPRGMSLGATMMLPEQDRYMMAKAQLMAQLRTTLAGRVVEELFMGDISTGAGNDIQTATEIARRMVCEWGMSESVGPIRYTSEEHKMFIGGDIINPREHSEETARRIDEEVSRIIREATDGARQLIEGNRDMVDRLARALLEHEVLTADQMDRIVAGERIEPPLPAGETSGEAEADRKRSDAAESTDAVTEDLPGADPAPEGQGV